MKRVLPHPVRETRPALWRSLDELSSSPDFAAKLEQSEKQRQQVRRGEARGGEALNALGLGGECDESEGQPPVVPTTREAHRVPGPQGQQLVLTCVRTCRETN